MKTSGKWGNPILFPDHVKEALDDFRKRKDIDWTSVGAGGKSFLIARLYEEPNHGQIIIARIEHEEEWNDG